jgi:hypothetical protein
MTIEDQKKTKRRRARGSGGVYQKHVKNCPRKKCGCVWWVVYAGHDGQRIFESSYSKRKGDAERLLQRVSDAARTTCRSSLAPNDSPSTRS